MMQLTTTSSVSQTLQRYVRLMASAVRRSSVCRLWRSCTLLRGLNILAIFLHQLTGL